MKVYLYLLVADSDEEYQEETGLDDDLVVVDMEAVRCRVVFLADVEGFLLK